MTRQVFKRMVIAFIAVLGAITSCNKDDELCEPVMLLERLTSIGRNNKESYYVFKYDKNYRITEYFYYAYGDFVSQSNKLTYNNNGDLVKLEVKESDLHQVFIRIGNKITYGDSENLVEIELDILGLPVKRTFFRKDGSDTFEIQTTVFIWENGNLIREISTHYEEQYNYSANYTYDHKKSPFYNSTTPKWFLMYRLGIAHCSMNNVETATYSWNPELTLTSRNTYNDDGFLVSRTGWSVFVANVYKYMLKK